MKVDVSISGIATSIARMRALTLVREAIAKRETEATDKRRSRAFKPAGDFNQQTRGK